MLIILVPIELNGIQKNGVQKKREIILKKKKIQIYHRKVKTW